MDLATLTFIQDNEKITLEKYVKDYVTEKVEEYIKENPFTDLTNLLLPFADSITDFAIDKAFSSKFINTAIKTQIHSIVDYFLYSDTDEAIKRIKNGVTLEDNVALNPDNAPTFEERVSAEVKMAVFKYIEKESGVTCDQIIVLVSEKTVTALKIVTVITAIIAVALFFPVSSLRFFIFSWILEGYRGQMYSIQVDFKEHYDGMHDLASYEFLKPLMDIYFEHTNELIDFEMILFLAAVVLTIITLLIQWQRKKKAKTT